MWDARYTYSGDWLVSNVHRPTEDEALKNVLRGFSLLNDTIHQERKYSVEFNAIDWQIYQLMMYHAKRVVFGSSDKQLTRELEALHYCAEHLNMSYDEIFIHHMDLCTKMARRGLRNLQAVPDVPTDVKAQHKALVKRIEMQLLDG